MTTQKISEPAEPRIWTKIWHGIRAFDEAMDHDPSEALHRRVEILETRLQGLEANTHADQGSPDGIASTGGSHV